MEEQTGSMPPLNLAALLDAFGRLAQAAIEGDEDALLHTVAREAATLVGATRSSVGLVDPETGDVVIRAFEERPQAVQRSRFPPHVGAAGWVLASGAPLLIQDTRRDPRFLRLRYPSILSFTTVPMRYRGAVIGTISCGHYQPGAFAEEHVSALQPLADFAAFAVELGRRYRSSVSQTRAMQEVLLDTLHDLRAPLGSVAGYLDMLLSGTAGSLNAQQEEFVRVARDECRRVLDHVATTLGAAASHALPPLELECVDVETIVKEAVAVALPAATEHGVQLLVAAEANLPTVAADPGALLRLLTNVLDNALRYSPPGGTVRIAAETHEASIRIHVDDEGPGWSEDALQHAFERGSLRASGGGGGLGLGLAICKAIAEAHGGTIAIANRPEGGARVTVSLPLQPKAACASRH